MPTWDAALVSVTFPPFIFVRLPVPASTFTKSPECAASTSKMSAASSWTSPVPNAFTLVATSVPAAIVVPPLYGLVLVRIVAPVPAWVTVPTPEMRPSTVNMSDRLNTNAALSTMSPRMLPLVPPSPSCNVPPLIVVPPV